MRPAEEGTQKPNQTFVTLTESSRLHDPSVIAQPLRSVALRSLKLALFLLLWMPFPLWAEQGDRGELAEEVLILPAGGTQALPVFVVHTGESPSIIAAGQQPIRLQDQSTASYTDLVVLPGGSLLLGDGFGRGAVRFSVQGDQVFSLFERNSMIPPTSVVAAAYIGMNEPDLLLLGDSSTGRVQLYDVISRIYTWTASLSRAGVRGQPRRAVLLPGGRVAVVVHWPSLELSALKIFPLEANPLPEQALYSQEVEPATEDGTLQIQPLLFTPRDLAADLDGRLLVTTAEHLLLLAEDLSLLASLSLADLPQVSGEFQSARFLDSGKILAATRQPGQWNTPHQNHRLHLFSLDEGFVYLTQSTSLDRAPLRVEVRQSQGGTGTRDYFADALEDQGPGLEAILVESALTVVPRRFPRDEAGHFQFRLLSTGPGSILVRRIELRTQQGACEDLALPDALTRQAFLRTNQELFEGEPRTYNGLIDPIDLAIGPHCVQIALTGRSGDRLFVGEALTFEVLPPSDARESAVSVEDLPRLEPGEGDGTGPHLEESQEGCACATSSQGGPTAPLVLLVTLAFLWTQRPRLRARSFSW